MLAMTERRTWRVTMTDDRLDWHLCNWAKWLCLASLSGDYSAHASGGIGFVANIDFDALVEKEDFRCAEAVAAIVDDLPIALRMAVRCKHLEERWPVLRSIELHGTALDLLRPREDLYAEARQLIKKGLTERGID